MGIHMGPPPWSAFLEAHVKETPDAGSVKSKGGKILTTGRRGGLETSVTKRHGSPNRKEISSMLERHVMRT